ncbi:hypothetical protein X777_10646 [Ooceraea biroi]|uniref:Uncharacterized protein n=1 Tax=Ooceraea biroi TaxID=2015173 RepID=A0A026W352_OOCBI|nr:hypothetical protein X777_10646 [Ooceraea biroi]
MKSEEWDTGIRDGWLERCCGVSESRGAGGGGGWSGWLVGDALRELPAARSRDSYPRPIIDRSPEERRTHCTRQALYLAPYQFSKNTLEAEWKLARRGKGMMLKWTKEVGCTSKRHSALCDHAFSLQKFYSPDIFAKAAA